MSLAQIDEFLNKLNSSNMPFQRALNELSKIEELEFLDLKSNFDLQMLELMGLRVQINEQNEFELKSKNTAFKKDSFCVVDIETNGSFKNGGQIIELGAIRFEKGRKTGHFHSLVYAKEVPLNIAELTGISEAMLKDAPSLKSVLYDFRLFLKDDIFVAHNAKFDYTFISNSLHKMGLGVLLNQKLCTIDLARRVIMSERYSLAHLKELLGLKSTHHRALSDAEAALEILKFCFGKMPFYLKSTAELLNFSKNAKTMKALEK